MAPKKSINTTEKGRKLIVKPPRKKQKIEKPKLRTPSIIKYKPPPISKLPPAVNIFIETTEIKEEILSKFTPEETFLNSSHCTNQETETASYVSTDSPEACSEPRTKKHERKNLLNVTTQATLPVAESTETLKIKTEIIPRQKRKREKKPNTLVVPSQGTLPAAEDISTETLEIKTDTEVFPKPVKRGRKLNPLNATVQEILLTTETQDVNSKAIPKAKKNKGKKENPLNVTSQGTAAPEISTNTPEIISKIQRKRAPRVKKSVPPQDVTVNEDISPAINVPTQSVEISNDLKLKGSKKVKKLNLPLVVNKGYVKRKINLKNAKVKEPTPKKGKRGKIKLDPLSLANEVAMAQFGKIHTDIVEEAPKVVRTINDAPSIKKRLSLKKTPVINDILPPDKKTPIKRGRPKRVTNDAGPPKVTRKRKADSTVTQEIKKPNLGLITRTIQNTLCNTVRQEQESVKGKDSSSVSDATVDGYQTSPSILQVFDTESSKAEKNVKSSPLLRRLQTKDTLNATSASKFKRNPAKGLLDNNSLRSSNSNLSDHLHWTKDISSSSTTTCVTVSSDDIVRVDGKVPYIRLFDEIKKERETVLSSSESATDNSTKCSDKELEFTPETFVSNSLNLSISSATHSSKTDERSSQVSEKTASKSKMSSILSKLSSNLKRLDFEFISWTEYQNEDSDIDINKYQESIFEIFEEERELMICCQNIKRTLSGTLDNSWDNVQSPPVVPDLRESYKIFSPSKNTEYASNSKNTDNDKRLRTVPASNGKAEEELHKQSHYSCDQNDDDDALSLFAESISAIETFKERTNEPMASLKNCIDSKDLVIDDEEYIPEPISKVTKPKEINYFPTKIVDKSDETIQTPHTIAVCEKHNADSTSISRDTEPEQLNVGNNLVDEFDYESATKGTNTNFDIVKATNNLVSPIVKNKPLLIKDYQFKALGGVQSSVFKGVCFYNLISNCKRTNCAFPHRVLDKFEVPKKLLTLTDNAFIQEYILILSWPELRRKYVMCFVDEAVRRNLPRILIEMGIDSITKANPHSKEDAVLKVNVMETILSYLGDKDLDVYEDLLQHSVGNGVLLCDVFMEVIAETQNFSRFKAVFANLTNFIVRIKRTFDSNVASHILERVCILPPEEFLFKALIKLIHNTDVKIFENSMMNFFQKRLAALKGDLLKELLSFKEQAIVHEDPAPVGQFVSSPVINRDNSQIINPNMQTNTEKRYTSPDTTNTDNMMKGFTEPVITRTINLPKYVVNNYQSSTSTSTSDSMEEYRTPNVSRNSVKQRRNWNSKSIFDKIRSMNTHTAFNGPKRSPQNQYMEQRRVAFGGSPTKQPQWPGPNFS